MGKLLDKQREMLESPLDAKHVSTREQAGRTLSYLEGHYVIEAANKIFGYDGWSYDIPGGIHGVVTEECGRIKMTDPNSKTDKYIPGYLSKATVKVTVRLDDGTEVSRTDVGSCTPAIATNKGVEFPTPEAIDTSEKGAVTDALKRALRSFGNQFGNGLYDKTNPLHNKHLEGKPSRECAVCNGKMYEKSGEKNGRAWSGWFCSSGKKCPPVFN